MSAKITDFFNPIQVKVKITPKTVKNVRNQKDKKCSVVLKDCFEEIENGKFKNLKLGPNVNNSAGIFPQNQTKLEQKENSKLKIKNYEKNCEKLNKQHFDKVSKQYECDFCGKSFMAKGNLYYHMKMHLSKVNCYICQAELRSGALKRHMDNVHAKGTNFQCLVCEKAFKSKQLLSIHVKIHDKKFECKDCTKKFGTNSKLNFHIKYYHLNSRSFPCEICGSKYHTKNQLKDHQKIHDKNRPKPFKCQRCDYASDNRVHYQTHMKSHQRQDEKIAAMKNPIKCEKCPAFLKDKKALSHHMNKVHPKKLFQCDLCGKYIKAKNNLTKHIKLHIKNRIRRDLNEK